jgi:hypothetical protein
MNDLNEELVKYRISRAKETFDEALLLAGKNLGML